MGSGPRFGKKILCDSGVEVAWAAWRRDTSWEPAVVPGHRTLTWEMTVRMERKRDTATESWKT